MKKIAIIGSGISGLYAAYLLNKDYDLTIYEKENYLGGHTRTLSIEYDNNYINVDTGFIVFNKKNYPNFSKMINKLNVEVSKSDMSFAVTSNKAKDPEIKYSDVRSFFANKRNIISYKHYNLLFNINKFNTLSIKSLNSLNNYLDNITLNKFLEDNNFDKFFIDNYIVPMGSSIWSCKPSQILQFPYLSYVNFMNNHGLLSISNQPQWLHIKNGSKTYVKCLKEYLTANIRLNDEVKCVIKTDNGIKISSSDGDQVYDYVFFSNHPNEILNIGKSLSTHQTEILKDIKYSVNEVVLHKDSSVMPKNAKCWASWVYKKAENDKPILSYWMNSLQNIDKKYPIFVSLNPGDHIDSSKIFNRHQLEHPIFDLTARNAQKKIPLIQGMNNFFFCGAYNKYGFHEDGVVSSIKAVEKLKIIDN
jgi:predicted NAD/FAD-binding protein